MPGNIPGDLLEGEPQGGGQLAEEQVFRLFQHASIVDSGPLALVASALLLLVEGLGQTGQLIAVARLKMAALRIFWSLRLSNTTGGTWGSCSIS